MFRKKRHLTVVEPAIDLKPSEVQPEPRASVTDLAKASVTKILMDMETRELKLEGEIAAKSAELQEVRLAKRAFTKADEVLRYAEKAAVPKPDDEAA